MVWGYKYRLKCKWWCGCVVMDMNKGMSMGSVLKNGFGILNFAEAPNLFRPVGVYMGGEGGW